MLAASTLAVCMAVGVIITIAQEPAPAEEAPITPAAEAAPPAAPPAPAIPATAPAPPPATPAVTPPDSVIGMQNGHEETTGVTKAEEGTITVNLVDVPLQDVVSMFARIADANIIASASNLQETVTVNLQSVQWRPALDSILDMHGLTLIEKTPGSRIFTVMPRSAGPEPLEVETVFLKYANVSNVAAAVTSMLSPSGSMSQFPSRNALVVKTTKKNLGEIQKIIGEIDRERQQVYIEAKFLELNDEAIQDLGINWQLLEGLTVRGSGISAAYDDVRHSIIQDDSGGIGVQSHLNTRSRDEVDGVAMEGTDLGSESFGREVYEVKAQGDNISNLSIDDGGLTWDSYAPYESTETRAAILSMDEFRVILSALKKSDGVSIVSNPKIIVANEEEAAIHIGQVERPFISSVTAGQQGIAPVRTYNPGTAVEYGVKLKVRPTVNTKDNISLQITPELTRFIRNTEAPDGQTYPIIATKVIKTVFSLESGKTAAIGGLTETTEREVVSKIPLLGDIPLIGKYLFSHSHTEKKKQETIIFVTVGLAHPKKIKREIGIPRDSQIIHRHLLRSAIEKKKAEEELEKLRKNSKLTPEELENP